MVDWASTHFYVKRGGKHMDSHRRYIWKRKGTILTSLRQVKTTNNERKRGQPKKKKKKVRFFHLRHGRGETVISDSPGLVIIINKVGVLKREERERKKLELCKKEGQHYRN